MRSVALGDVVIPESVELGLEALFDSITAQGGQPAADLVAAAVFGE